MVGFNWPLILQISTAVDEENSSVSVFVLSSDTCGLKVLASCSCS